MATSSTTPTDTEAFDERAARALVECMTVIGDTPRVQDDSERFEVFSASGNRYLVDLRAEACGCHDCLHRGVECKHRKRVLFATGRQPIPGWADLEAIDPLLGEHTTGDPLVVQPDGHTIPLARAREHIDNGVSIR
jgi:hypothetical protein